MSSLAKADLGTKRICPSCQARFYDLQKRPIECPKCHFAFEPEALYKQRRPRQPEAEPQAAVAAETEEHEEEAAVTEEEEATGAGMTVVEGGEAEDIEGIEDEGVVDEDEEDTGLLEEVEEDGDDVAGIIDPGVTKDER